MYMSRTNKYILLFSVTFLGGELGKCLDLEEGAMGRGFGDLCRCRGRSKRRSGGHVKFVKTRGYPL